MVMELVRCVKWLLGLLAGCAFAPALATPFVALENQAPRANRMFGIRVIPTWNGAETVVPRIYLDSLDRPDEGVRVVDAAVVPPTAGQLTIFHVALPAGVYALRYYAAPAPDLTQPADLVHTFVVNEGDPVRVVEYYSPSLDHYFVTADSAEMQALDSGTQPGWLRTGYSFFGIDGRQTLSVYPVCRLYGLPSAGLDTHFYSDTPDECDGTLERWPDKWVKETSAAFALPVDFAAGCDTIEYALLYRLYNNRPDANHRYTTSIKVVQEMVSAGWVVEGSRQWNTFATPYWSCALSGSPLQ